MAELDAHQQVPVTEGERTELRQLAARYGVRPGIFARALLLYARDRLGDKALNAVITAEQKASTERSSQAAVVAAQARWGSK
ncbi:MAG: hypothetical protein INR62_05590 [Rhodospirillales bacterium]|nr:hypothetical protein [Acetobacter sp.]